MRVVVVLLCGVAFSGAVPKDREGVALVDRRAEKVNAEFGGHDGSREDIPPGSAVVDNNGNVQTLNANSNGRRIDGKSKLDGTNVGSKIGNKPVSASGFATGSGENTKISGGFANTGRENARFRKNSDGTISFADSDGHKGSAKQDPNNEEAFTSQIYTSNGQVEQYGVNDKTKILKLEDGSELEYTYASNRVSDGTTTLIEVDDGTPLAKDRRLLNAKCSAVKNGEQKCYYDNKQVGSVKYGTQGNKRTCELRDKNNIKVADCETYCNGQAPRLREGQPLPPKTVVPDCYVVLTNKIYEVSTDQVQQRDCFDEAIAKVKKDPLGGFSGSKEFKSMGEEIEVENIRVEYDSDKRGSVEEFKWPDCVKLSATVTVPASIDPSRLEVQYTLQVLPLGPFVCHDALQCPGRKCHYCNLCGAEQKKGGAINGNSNICDGKVQRKTFQFSARMCPTDEDAGMFTQCAKFDRALLNAETLDYYKYKHEVKAELRFWYGPPNYHNALTSAYKPAGFLDFQRKASELALKTKFQLTHNRPPTKAELADLVVSTKTPSVLLKCRVGEIGYNLGGKKVPSSLMLDWWNQASTQLNGGGNGARGFANIYPEKPCNELQDLWKQRERTYTG